MGHSCLCIMNSKWNRSDRRGQIIQRTHTTVQRVRERVARSLAASQEILQSEDARWRALVVVGRFTAHSAIVFVLLLALILAGLGLGAASRGGARAAGAGAGADSGVPSTALTSLGSAQSAPRSPVILAAGNAGRLFVPGGPGGNFQPAGASDQDVSLIVRDVILEAAKLNATRAGIITYTVQQGDNVETIAQRFGLLPTTIVWSNREVEDNPDVLRVGQQLNILPSDGIWYTVEPADTLSSIAGKFKANQEDIVNLSLNNMSAASNLLPGMRIIVPGGVKPFVPKVVQPQVQPRRAPAPAPAPALGQSYSGPAPSFAPSGSFIWPTRGFISQGYWAGHRAFDIANAMGIPVVASDSGYVTYAGWSPVGYGYMVQIDHGNGFSTLYAHLSQWYVEPGQTVARGQVVAAMGNSGNSTGPHTHFEIRYNGVPQNPRIYLP